MSDTQLFIPNKLKIGYQARKDTYTGKLAYVIYFDQTGKLRKEKSWENWRSKDIDPVEVINEPIEGFVLNKNVGGYKSDWNYRNAHIRVYDPRDFEFEISLENLLFILRDCDCSRGKGLEGKFVYAWDNTELVLLPVTSENYKKSQAYTELQAQGVKSKDLIEGASYLTKKQEVLIFLSRRVIYPNSWNYTTKQREAPTKMYVFWNVASKIWVFLKDLKSLATVISDTVIDNYAQMVVDFQNSQYATPIVRLELISSEHKEPNDYRGTQAIEKDGWIYICQDNHYSSRVPGKQFSFLERIRIVNNELEIDQSVYGQNMYAPDFPSHYEHYGRQYPLHKDRDLGFWINPENKKVLAVLESGAAYQYIGYASGLGGKNYNDPNDASKVDMDDKNDSEDEYDDENN